MAKVEHKTPQTSSAGMGAGEMAALLKAKDWSKTAIGSESDWSPSLRLTANLVLSAGFPTALRWGPEFVLIYNDGYRSILGDKHPWAFGLPSQTAWSEVWSDIRGYHEDILQGRRTAFFSEDHPLRIKRRDDQWEDGRFTLSYSPVPDETAPAGVGGVMVTVVETTARVHAEAALGDLNATLEQRVVSEVQERGKAEEALRQSLKMEAIGQLTGGIAHDFNNLLTGVIGSLDLMKTRIAQGRIDQVVRLADAASVSANRAASLTHRLLAYARRQPLDPHPVDLNQLVGSMEDLLRGSISEKIKITFVKAGGLWPTFCDQGQLETALLNLAINARDAMPAGGRLTVETCNAHIDDAYAAKQPEAIPGQYVCLAVTDSGQGMAPETVARAFDPFFTTKPIGQGTGLGLSLVYGFARQSEGHARIYSEPGQGTTVKLYLPRYRGALKAAPVDNPARRPPVPETADAVLVIEDEPLVRELVVDVLNELGCRAFEAADGPSGLDILRSDERIDLLVTDIGLPGLNGRQVAEAARKLRPNLKVLFITGYAANAAIANGFLEPDMELITKPFTLDTVAARVRMMLSGR